MGACTRVPRRPMRLSRLLGPDVREVLREDPEQVRDVLDELFDEFRDELRKDAEMKAWVMDGPSVLGVETTNDRDIVIRVVAETRPSRKVDVERILRARITRRLAERGIRAPVAAAPPPAAPGA